MSNFMGSLVRWNNNVTSKRTMTPKSRAGQHLSNQNLVATVSASNGIVTMQSSSLVGLPHVEKTLTSRTVKMRNHRAAVTGATALSREAIEPDVREPSASGNTTRRAMAQMPVYSGAYSSLISVQNNNTIPRNINLNNPIQRYEVNNNRYCFNVQSVSKTEACQNSNSMRKLFRFLHENGLKEPSIKTMNKRASANEMMLYDCRLTVGTHSYSNYPKELHDKESALEHTAAVALMHLKELYSTSETLLLSNEQDILGRLPALVDSHSHGIWASQLQLDYENQFNEKLPANWLTLLDTLPTISVEPTLHNKFVLKKFETGQSSMSGKAACLVPANSVQVPENGCVVQITCAISTIEVWCRQLDTPEAAAYEVMYEEMEEFYKRSQSISPNVIVGGFYVVHYQNCWSRVRVLQILDNCVLCFFIDYGDEELIPKMDIFNMNGQFVKPEAQAFVCGLAGLENIVNIPCASAHLTQIIGNRYLLKPTKRNSNSILMIELYENEGVELVNKKLYDIISIDSAYTSLDKKHMNKVYVTHAEKNGILYVQIHTDGYEKFINLMDDLEGTDFIGKVPNYALCENEIPDQLYLTKWSADGAYYRCVVADQSPDKIYAQIYFVDYGNTDIIKLQSSVLFPMELISEKLSLFPYQIIKVRIDIEVDKLPPNFTEVVTALLPPEQQVFVKVLRESDDNIPICEFFKRSEADNILFSVNTSLQLESELHKILSDTQSNNDKTSKLTNKILRLKSVAQLKHIKRPIPSTGTLRKPILPAINEFFDVYVSDSVSPYNFSVQPYTSREQLRELMEKLQEYCNSAAYIPVRMEDVQPGQIFAAKYDSLWYRISVIKVIHPGSISVYYCDYGYYSTLTLKGLKNLDKTFLDLPCQAIKAKLAGIKPVNDKWTMENCVWFNEFVTNKTFVSILLDIQKDEIFINDYVIYIEMFDTSSSTDVYIEELLIENGIAVHDSS